MLVHTELIAGKDTDPRLVDFIDEYCTKLLGRAMVRTDEPSGEDLTCPDGIAKCWAYHLEGCNMVSPGQTCGHGRHVQRGFGERSCGGRRRAPG